VSSNDQSTLFAIKGVSHQTSWTRHNRRKKLVGSKVRVHIGALEHRTTQSKIKFYRQRAKA